jgi:hypothetical protein
VQELSVTCAGQAGDGSELSVSCSNPSLALLKSEKHVESDEKAK